jgi:hypothetical protein
MTVTASETRQVVLQVTIFEGFDCNRSFKVILTP